MCMQSAWHTAGELHKIHWAITPEKTRSSLIANRFDHWFHFLAISNKQWDLPIQNNKVFSTFTGWIGKCCTKEMYRSKRQSYSKVMTFRGKKTLCCWMLAGKNNSNLRSLSSGSLSSQYPQCGQLLSSENLLNGCLWSSGSSTQLPYH